MSWASEISKEADKTANFMIKEDERIGLLEERGYQFEMRRTLLATELSRAFVRGAYLVKFGKHMDEELKSEVTA